MGISWIVKKTTFSTGLVLSLVLSIMVMILLPLSFKGCSNFHVV